MYIYNINKNILEVYKLNQNKKAITNYKKEQMNLIDEDKQILYTETYSGIFGETLVFEDYLNSSSQEPISIEEANKEIPDRRGNYHKLLPSNMTKEERVSLLEEYYLGKLTNCNVIKIKDKTKIRYLLLKNHKYEKSSAKPTCKTLKEIIEIPKSLYLLQLLEQGKFQLLNQEDIQEQLSMYTIELFRTINLYDLENIDLCELSENVYQNAINKSKNTNHILKRIKK